MSIKLRDLIKAVRACKTAADERAIISKESALIRTAFKEEVPEYRERNVAKLLYIHMLGYPTHFGQMECIKLLASGKFADKRIGYLALMLLLDEKQETLMLVTNSLQQDLGSSNQYVVGLSLTSIGNICGSEMARDLAGDVDKALKSGNPYIRKKAALAAIRMLKKVPELIDQFLPTVVSLLTDKNHAVLLTGVALVQAVLDTEPHYADRLQKLVAPLVRILLKLIKAPPQSEYDIGLVTDPFLQCRILGLLRVLGKTNAAAAEGMNAVLAQVASQTNTERNAGNAVLYDTVNTIMASEHSEEGLRVLAVNILGKFLTSTKDNNIRYVALSTLCRVVHRDAPAVQRHRAVIVECLKDGDVSIRRRALELTYSLVNEDNVRPLTKELLAYLAACTDPEGKADVCQKIAAVAEKYSPSLRWHVDTLIAMLSSSGNAAKKEVLSALVFHITHAPTPEEHAAIVHKLFTMAQSAAASHSAEAQQPLLQVAVWCVGEYGQRLTSAPPARPEADDPASKDMSGPFGEQRSEADIVRLLERIRSLHYASPETVGMVLVAALKLTVRLSEPAVLERLKRLIASYGTAANVELQTRSIEFSVITGSPVATAAAGAGAAAGGGLLGFDAPAAGSASGPSAAAAALLARRDVRAGLLDAMPVLDEAVLRLRTAAATGETATDAARLGGEEQVMAVAARGSVARPVAAAASAADPLGLGVSAGGGAGGAGAGSALADLDDLFGGLGGGSGSTGSTPTPTAGAAAAVHGHKPPAGHAAAAAAPAAAGGGLDDLFGMGPSSAPAPAPAAAAAAPAKAVAGGLGAGMGASALTSALDSLYGGSAGPSTAAAAATAGMGMGMGMGGMRPSPAAPPAAPAGSTSGLLGQLDELLGASPSPAPAPTGLGMGMGMGGAAKPAAPAAAPADPFASLGGGLGGTPAGAASAAAGGAVSHPPFVAYDSPSSGLRISLACVKPQGSASGLTDITATYTLTRPGAPALSGFMCQVAVPKTMKVTLLPASSSTVPAAGAGSVTQVYKVENSQHGQKPLALRLKLTYTPVGGAGEVTEQTDVKNFPAGL